MTTLFISVISLLVGVLITRWIFGIPTILKSLKAQTELLGEIAKRQGVDLPVIDKILGNSPRLDMTERKTDYENHQETVDGQLISNEELEKEALSHPKQ